MSWRSSASHLRPKSTIIRNCYVAKDRATALHEMAPYIEQYYDQVGGWGLFRDIIKSDSDQPDLATMLAGRVVFGSPDDVASELKRFNTRFGVNHVLCRVGWQGMDNRLVRAAVHLLGTEVLPRLAD